MPLGHPTEPSAVHKQSADSPAPAGNPHGRRPDISTDALSAGASGGTLIAAIAQNLDPHDPLRPWLLSLAPFMTVVLGYIWSYVRRRIVEHFDDQRDNNVLKQVTLEAEKAKLEGASEEDLKGYEEIKSELRKKRQRVLRERSR
jgi:hypothetical protein